MALIPANLDCPISFAYARATRRTNFLTSEGFLSPPDNDEQLCGREIPRPDRVGPCPPAVSDNLASAARATLPWRDRGRVLTYVAIAVATAYCAALLARPQPFWPALIRKAIGYPSQWLSNLIDAGLYSIDAAHAQTELRSGIYLLFAAGVVPWLVLALLGRGRPHDLGFRRPNRLGWRFVVVGYLIACPFLVWMVRGTDFAGPYLRQLQGAGGLAFCLYYFINMLTEHFFFHGALLAVFRVGGRWPAPPQVSFDGTGSLPRVFQWMGFTQPPPGVHGMRRVLRGIGLPDGCLLAVLASAVLFSLVHLGKDPRELLLSLPGGIALGYLAYRTNTWLVPFVLHLATAGTACAIIVITH